MRNVLHPCQFDRKSIDEILDLTATMEVHAGNGWDQPKVAKNKVMATMFFEPSTRTRLSFEAAMLRLGGQTVSVADGDTSSVRKGESLADTLMTVSQYADVLVVRHPTEGASKWADMATIPVINAGDGAGHHPTQSLLDLYTIRQHHKTLDGLSIMFVGDIKHSRTAHSLLAMLSHYKPAVYLCHPPGLEPATVNTSMTLKLCPNHQDKMPEADVVYMIRPQKERWPEGLSTRGWSLGPECFESMKETACVLHPLPRNDELPPEFDKDPRCLIWKQVKNGLYVRMALLSKILGNDPLS